VSDLIVARAVDFDLILIGGNEADSPQPAIRTEAPRRHLDAAGYAWATLGVALATGIGAVVDRYLQLANISVIFLIAVMLIAMRLGRGPAIFASVASFLTFNFFFTVPRFSFSVSDTQNLLTIFFFLAAAFIVSNLAGRVRRQIEATRLNARRISNLYEFNRRIAGAAGRDDVLWAVVHHVAATMRGRSLVLLPQEGRLAIAAAIRRKTRSPTATRPPPPGPGSTACRPGSAPRPCPAPTGCSCR